VRLAELRPRWLAEPGRVGQGIVFDCPCCVGTARALRLGIVFGNPVDGGEPLPHFNSPGISRCAAALWNESDGSIGEPIAPPGTHWQRTGSTFEDLTLSPSVDYGSARHWHGFLTNGVCT
jgi:hypothetical protein